MMDTLRYVVVKRIVNAKGDLPRIGRGFAKGDLPRKEKERDNLLVCESHFRCRVGIVNDSTKHNCTFRWFPISFFLFKDVAFTSKKFEIILPSQTTNPEKQKHTKDLT